MQREVFAAITAMALLPWPVQAGNLVTSLSLTPDFLSVDMEPAEGEGLQEASFRSGMGLQLRNELLQLSVNYQVQSQFHEQADEAAVSQDVGASLRSPALDDALGLSAEFQASSTVRDGGDAYVYSLTPVFSKPLAELGQLDLRYEYHLDKPSAEAVEQQKLGYSMGLEGENGLISWKGRYRSTDVYGGVEQLQSTELVEFMSGLQLAPELRLEVSGKSKDEVRFDGGLESDYFTETRYGAGLAWSPTHRYSVAFKVNRLEASSESQEEVFGSGTVSWFPRRDMEFTLSYGDHLVEGARGVMLSTRIDLNGS